MAKDLVFEIGTEEIPAGFIPRALESIEGALRKKLEGGRLTFKGIRRLGTPRRLALIIEGLIEKQPDMTVEAWGPQKKAAYDESGAPTKALLGFAQAQGVKVKDIKTVSTEKGEYVYAVRKIKGENTVKILPGILKEVISGDYFPKSMRWGSHDVSFARPVHWILAVYGGRPVGFEFGHIRSGPCTYGHRFSSGRTAGRLKPVKVTDARSYIGGLKRNGVIVDPEERRKTITEGLKKGASGVKGKVLPDEGLLEEVTYLVEYPVIVRGSFDSEFLSMPRDVIINAMREHQRYFAVVDAKGDILPYFLTVANTKARKMEVVRKGNERVLRARLNDAKFYYEKDVRVPLTDLAEKLKGVVFQAKLGTSFEKVERFTDLALYIGARVGFSKPLEAGEKASDFLTDSFNPSRYDAASTDPGLYSKFVLGRSAMLSKADLTSGMVGEFPKLQGIMGSVYARRAGEAEAVATAIFEHYLPTASGGALPASIPGAVVSIADKLDTITGCFGVGLIPTGAADPYALRRNALGIIAIILDKSFPVPIDELIDKSIELLGSRLTRKPGEVRASVLEFFRERLKNQLLAQGLSFDSIEAVLSAPWCDMVDAVKRVRALEDFKKHPACPSLVVAFKRVSNILKGQDIGERMPDPSLFENPVETALDKTAGDISGVIEDSCKRGDYRTAFETLASIKESIDSFFDKIMVMVDDERIRTNRLALLNRVRRLYFRIADLSKLSA